jgi:hypothetical protein
MKPLLDLTDGECRYPIDEVDGQHLFCGLPGTPYCVSHHQLCYRGTARKLAPTKTLLKTTLIEV